MNAGKVSIVERKGVTDSRLGKFVICIDTDDSMHVQWRTFVTGAVEDVCCVCGGCHTRI